MCVYVRARSLVFVCVFVPAAWSCADASMGVHAGLRVLERARMCVYLRDLLG